MKNLIVLMSILTLYSCASGKIDYHPPKMEIKKSNTKTVSSNFHNTWSKVIEKISETAYSINNMNKESGFINIEYTIKDPQAYINCGTFKGFYKGPRIDEKYDFGGNEPYMKYHVFSKPNNSQIYERRLKLEGTTNLYLKKISNSKTELKVNIKYRLRVNTDIHYMDNNYRWRKSPSFYNVEFSTKKSGRADNGSSKLVCEATGELEKLFLDMI